MKELNVGKNDAGQRLDRFVTKVLPLLPAGLLQKFIRTKRIKVNGKAANSDERVSEGDTVQLYIKDEFFKRSGEENAYLKIFSPELRFVYEDENILLADKRPGVLCHSNGRGEACDTLIANIQAHCRSKGDWIPRDENSFAPALCNRIDRNTGGIVIAAKNAKSLRIMNEKIRGRELGKYYLCAVHGAPEPKEGTLKDYILKDQRTNQVSVQDKTFPGAKEAVTEYRTIQAKNGLSLLECRLLTGRTHQIRAQLAAIGTPLLGDRKYGPASAKRKDGEKYQALYSYRLSFDFQTDAGMLNYLKGRQFFVSNVDFVEKYFDWHFPVDIQ